MHRQSHTTAPLIVGILLISALVLSSCASAVVGVGTAAVAASTTEKGFSTSVSDGIIFTKLNEKFLQQNQSLLSSADVEVNDGEIILTGRVKTQEDKALATKLSWGIKGVKSVINHLTVAKPPTLKQIGKDNAAVGLFRTKIGLDQDISSLNFSIDVVDGIAYLSGIAKDEIEMNKVIYHAENTRFISDVMNYITLSIDQRD
ncbi:BON domain-containing protein [Alphaproteobacteria bacterium]|nr:BON domain-containing protein [Alphaproteobacteria bacterium]